MPLDRPRHRVLAVALFVVCASSFVPGAFAPGVSAQAAGQSEGEPNDSPLNATFVGPGAQVSGEVTESENASEADADWFAVPAQEGRNVSVSFEAGNDSERLLVFLASPSRSQIADPNAARNASANASAINDTLADATIAPPGSTVSLNATANGSQLYLLGVTGRSGEYDFTVETSAGLTASAIGANGTNLTVGAGTNATGDTNATGTATGTATTTETTSTMTTTATATPTETTTESTTASAPATSTADGGTGDSTAGNGGTGGNAGEETSASGPGFGVLVALVALLAAALLVTRRR